eukprot:TRINITY_DN47360_c0_g1_i1.p1 TRINITY_DN47360_c0_g1~~TRINITY_DN47360_c0_g1_i1.p1  ORF type:complete len:543 (+),score=25.14 TRINITY_DN47360_c0_g1_i1:347-1975(+)
MQKLKESTESYKYIQKIMVLHAISLFLLFFIFSYSRALERMRNLDYIANGYNIFKGNPLPMIEGIDKGFSLHKVFNLSYSSQKRSSDGRWNIPDNTEMQKVESCNFQFSSEEFHSMEEYTRSLTREASISASVPLGKFSYSQSYQEMSKDMQKKDFVYILSKAECSAYEAAPSRDELPDFTGSFIKSVKRLPKEYNYKLYLRFIETYGTHLIERLTMGARYYYLFRIDTYSYSKARSEGINTLVAASILASKFSGSIEARIQENSAYTSAFERKIVDYKQFVIGSKPIINGNSVDWAKQVIEEPMPIKYTLYPISDVFDSVELQSLLSDYNLEAVKQNVERIIKEFAEKELTKGCRFTMESCSNSEVYMGSYKATSEEICSYDGKLCADKKHHYVTDSFWFGGGHHYYITGYISRALCCDKNDKAILGECALCESCGGEFPINNGAFHLGRRDNSVFKQQCNGQLSVSSQEEFKLCCRKRASCRVCKSCGGEWSKDSGGFLKSMQNGVELFAMGYDYHCGGELKRYTYEQRYSLCCKQHKSS